jgi:hypothetical protein
MIKKRNPLIVGALGYVPYIIGYMALQIVLNLGSNPDRNGDMQFSLGSAGIIVLIIAGILIIAGSAYSLFWYVSTARALRKATGIAIPNSILYLIPFASYWWMWRYGQAAEVYTKGKLQGSIVFVVAVLLGGIGMFILQDTYNKIADGAPPVAPLPPASPIR